MSETTPAETLRKAAKLMRERARNASEGPWEIREEHGRDIADEAWSDVRVVGATEEVAITYMSNVIEGNPREDNETHIASWHPGVALAVADLLDKIAWMGEVDPDLLSRVGCDEAFAIARAYLGTKGEGRCQLTPSPAP